MHFCPRDDDMHCCPGECFSYGWLIQKPYQRTFMALPLLYSRCCQTHLSPYPHYYYLFHHCSNYQHHFSSLNIAPTPDSPNTRSGVAHFTTYYTLGISITQITTATTLTTIHLIVFTLLVSQKTTPVRIPGASCTLYVSNFTSPSPHHYKSQNLNHPRRYYTCSPPNWSGVELKVSLIGGVHLRAKIPTCSACCWWTMNVILRDERVGVDRTVSVLFAT